MANYIENPINHQEWNPQMGDFFCKRVYEEDRLYAKKQLKKKIMVGGLISIHIILLTVIFFYFG